MKHGCFGLTSYKDAGLVSFQLPTASGLLPAGSAIRGPADTNGVGLEIRYLVRRLSLRSQNHVAAVIHFCQLGKMAVVTDALWFTHGRRDDVASSNVYDGAARVHEGDSGQITNASANG